MDVSKNFCDGEGQCFFFEMKEGYKVSYVQILTLSAAGLFKYVWPFCYHQALKALNLLLNDYEFRIYFKYCTPHGLCGKNEKWKMWQKVFAMKSASFFLKWSRAASCLSWFIRKSIFVWNITNLTHYEKYGKKWMFRKTFQWRDVFLEWKMDIRSPT